MNKEQTISLVRGFALLIVMVAGMFGLHLDEDTAQVIAIGIAMVAIMVYSLWKNHNITPAAALAQQVLDLLKEKVLTFELVEAMIDEARNQHAEVE
ncbi:MAG: hypothetical protein IJG53_08465 [Eggerthellaceae bacterium]|nr:hypothetical protein [Eggerthellaceae bacterium]